MWVWICITARGSSCLAPGLQINPFYTRYVSACVDTAFGLVQIGAVTFALFKGDILAVVWCVHKFILGRKESVVQLRKCANTEKILSLGSRNCAYLLCSFLARTVIQESSVCQVSFLCTFTVVQGCPSGSCRATFADERRLARVKLLPKGWESPSDRAGVAQQFCCSPGCFCLSHLLVPPLFSPCPPPAG